MIFAAAISAAAGNDGTILPQFAITHGNVLNGYPTKVESGKFGHAASDINYPIFLPFHRSLSVEGDGHRCSELDVRHAVPLAEAASLAFDLINNASTGALRKTKFGYSLFDTCSAVSVVFARVQDLHQVTSAKKQKHYEDFQHQCGCRKDDKLRNQYSGTNIMKETSLNLGSGGSGEGHSEAGTLLDHESSSASGSAGSDSLNPGSGALRPPFHSFKNIDDYLHQQSLCIPPLPASSVPVVTPSVFIGPTTNKVTSALTSFFHLRNMSAVQISPTPASDSDGQGDSRSVKTSPSSKEQMDELLDICVNNTWSHVALVVSRDRHSQELRSTLQSRADKKDICIATVLTINTNHQHTNEFIWEFFLRLKDLTTVTTVLFLAGEDVAVTVWSVLEYGGSHYSHVSSESRFSVNSWQWLGVLDWKYVADQVYREGKPRNIADCLIAVRASPKPHMSRPLPTMTWRDVENRLRTRLDNIQPTVEVERRNPWLTLAWEHHMACQVTCKYVFELSRENVTLCEKCERQKMFRHTTFSSRDPPTNGHVKCSNLTATPPKNVFPVDQALALMDIIFTVVNVTGDILLTKLQQLPGERPFNVENWTNDSASINRVREYLNNNFRKELSTAHNRYSQRLGKGRHMVVTRLEKVNHEWTMSPVNDRLAFLSDGRKEGRGMARDAETIKPSSCSPPCRSGYRRAYSYHTNVCCFNCAQCPKGLVSDATRTSTCSNCQSGFYAALNQSKCLPYTLVHVSWSDTWSVVVILFAGLGVVSVVTTLLLLRANRTKMVIKSADPTLSTALLVAVLLSFVCVTVLLVKPSSTVCLLQLALVPLWPVVYVACLAIKTNRLRVVFHLTSSLSRRSLRLLSNEMQLLVLTGVSMVTAVYFVMWGLLATPTARITEAADRRLLQCDMSSSWMGAYFAWTAFLMAVTAVLAYSTRRLPGYFNEALYHFLASAMTLVWWMVLVPAYYFSKELFSSQILATIIIAQGYTIFLSLFARRLYFLVIPPEESNSQFLSSSVMSSYSQNTDPLEKETPTAVPMTAMPKALVTVSKADEESDLTAREDTVVATGSEESTPSKQATQDESPSMGAEKDSVVENRQAESRELNAVPSTANTLVVNSPPPVEALESDTPTVTSTSLASGAMTVAQQSPCKLVEGKTNTSMADSMADGSGGSTDDGMDAGDANVAVSPENAKFKEEVIKEQPGTHTDSGQGSSLCSALDC